MSTSQAETNRIYRRYIPNLYSKYHNGDKQLLILCRGFRQRWGNNKLGAITKKELWEKLLKTYNRGFYCAYCGCAMTIEKGSVYSFSIEHSTNNYNNPNLSEIEIICTGCNMLKRSIKTERFKSLIIAIRAKYGDSLYDLIKKDIHNGLQKKIEIAKTMGKMGRPRLKVINIDMVRKLYKEEGSVERVAAILNISYSTLNNRLRQAQIKLEPGIDENAAIESKEVLLPQIIDKEKNVNSCLSDFI